MVSTQHAHKTTCTCTCMLLCSIAIIYVCTQRQCTFTLGMLLNLCGIGAEMAMYSTVRVGVKGAVNREGAIIIIQG